MSQGKKYIERQLAVLNRKNNNLKAENTRLNDEIRVLQSVQLSMLTPNIFKAALKWFIKWRKYRKS